jgi:DnaJ-class molecular chaperone
MSAVSNTCSTCSGSGFINGEVCSVCFGAGAVPAAGMPKLLIETLNRIVAEQAAQRIDLTAALTAIYNKVKDL